MLFRSGDLVLLFADALARSWKQVVHFRTPHSTDTQLVRDISAGAERGWVGMAPTPSATNAVEESATDDGSVARSTLGDDVVLVRDERGVHIARESDD